PSDLSFTYLLDWSGFADYCYQMKELADLGCWSPDVLSSSDERQTGLLTGRTAGMIWNLGSCKTYAAQANAENPDWNVTLVDPVSDQPKKVNSYINNGMAINVNSKNPERAMMVLNEFYTNQEINDMTRFGIEGKHWEAVGDDQYKVIDETNFGVDSNCNWGWMNNDIKRTEYIENRTPLDDTYDAMLESWNNNVKAEHVYDGFNFDSTNVTTQVAAVEAAISTYYDPLINGLVDDVDASLEALKEALESAGIRDIIAELEKQAADYVASK
ncbi:MAG: ABC transporter substrate-binding protein, partial [Bacillota bacterium]|nr:ABC transporter substrate-binding protein [Bacillota bacterium]